MKNEIYNVEGIEIEVERADKSGTDAERRRMSYSFKMIIEQSGMNRKDFHNRQYRDITVYKYSKIGVF